MGYRHEIDGIRAIAVLLVCFFHFHFPGFGGGYIGVDIFFVISGYLISGKILEANKQGTFSFMEFYAGRISRLFPALLATVVATMVASPFFLSANGIEDLAESAIYALFSLSNILFWMQSGYFDGDALTKPLLHTWSLSVEEQFYLFWPLLLVLIAIKRLPVLWTISIISGLSFIGCLIASYHAPSANFFLMPFRTWQFGLGALVFLLRPNYLMRIQCWLNALLITIALVVIAGSTFFFNEETLFPGWNALPVTLAAAILLIARYDGFYLKAFTNAIARFFGKISYSLYLVHWPVTTFAAAWNLGEFDVPLQVAITLLSVVLGTALHFVVEQRFRAHAKGSNSVKFVAMFFAAISLSCFVLSHIWTEGSRIALQVEPIVAQMRKAVAVARNNRIRAIENTAAAERKERSESPIAVFGDSAANDMLVILSRAYPEKTFIQITDNGCRPVFGRLFGNPKQKKRCEQFLKKAEETLLRQGAFKHVVIDTNWSQKAMQFFPETVETLQKSGMQVYLVEPRARLSNDYKTLVSNIRTDDQLFKVALGLSELDRSQKMAGILRSFENVKMINLIEHQCPKQVCTNMLPNKKQPIIYDRVHFTRQAMTHLAKKIRDGQPNLFD